MPGPSDDGSSDKESDSDDSGSDADAPDKKHDKDGAPKKKVHKVSHSDAKPAEDAAKDSDKLEDAAVLVTRKTHEATLMREFMNDALDISAFFTIATEGDDGDVTYTAFQVIEKERKPLQVKLFEEDASVECLFKVLVQPYALFHATLVHPPDFIDVFLFDGRKPQHIDVLSLVGVDPHNRERVQLWTPETSGIPACVQLTAPRPLRSKTSIDAISNKAPLLTFIDALQNCCYIGVPKRVKHTPTGPLQFDNRWASMTKPYMRCLLASSYVFEHGVAEFNSGQLRNFYELLLRSPALAKPGLKNAEYKALLKKGSESFTPSVVAKLGSIDVAPRYPARTPSTKKPVASSSKKQSSSPSSSDSESSKSPVKPRSESSTSSIHGESEERPDAGVYPKMLFGEVLHRREKVLASGDIVIDLHVRCPNPTHHVGRECTLSRRATLWTGDFGVQAPCYYLGTWLLNAHSVSQADHRRKPTKKEVRDHVATYGEQD